VGSHGRVRGRDRAQELGAKFGRRHPRLALIVVGVALAGVVALCSFQLSYGTYLGRGWVIAAFAGMATAAGVGAAVLISNRRHSPAAGRLALAWLALCVMSASAIRYPFPLGPYGSVQAFFNVVHAALLGYEALTCASIVAFFAYLVLHPRARARARSWTAQAGRAPDRNEISARLRFPGAISATWRAGRLTGANGAVRWRSLNGDAEVDLTSACQALDTRPIRPTDTHQPQPRTTILATANGLVELDVSPWVLEALSSSDDEGNQHLG
jgi:hypothetical protein